MKKTVKIIVCCLIVACTTSCGKQLTPQQTITQFIATMPRTTHITIATTAPAIETSTAESTLRVKLSYDRSKKSVCWIQKKLFSKKNTHNTIVAFSYPQIAGMKNKQKQKQINELIRKTVSEISMLNDEARGINIWDNFNMDYQIMLFTPDILSIVFEGDCRGDGGIGNRIATGFTVDLNTTRTLNLCDFFAIDFEVVKKVLNSESIACSGTVVGYFDSEAAEDARIKELQKDSIEELQEYSSEKMFDYLNTFGQYTKYFFLTEQSLWIKVNISHAAGDYIWVEVPFE